MNEAKQNVASSGLKLSETGFSETGSANETIWALLHAPVDVCRYLKDTWYEGARGVILT